MLPRTSMHRSTLRGLAELPRKQGNGGRAHLAVPVALSWLIALVAGAGCSPYQRLPVEPGASFGAHIVRGGLMVDEMRGDDQPALVTSTRWLPAFTVPELVVNRGPARGEGIWLEGPGHAVVRSTESPDSPVVGRVEPFWDHDAIRLVIEPAGSGPFWSDVFVRQPGWGTLS
jgi:hypothetical protein